MADTTSESLNGSTGPQQAYVDKLQIVATTGETVDVRQLLVEFSYFEDLYSFTTSGYVVLRDAYGVIENLKLSGNEKMLVSFGIAKDGGNIDNQFWLYGIPKKLSTGSMNQEIIKLDFTSIEMARAEKVTQSFNGTKISNAIKFICLEYLKTDKKLSIDDTLGIIPFNVPARKPFESITWMTNFAQPVSGVGADMLFFENRDGYNLKSLRDLYLKSPYKTYTYQQKSVSESLQQELNTVLEYEFTKNFNSMVDEHSGTFANRVMTMNPLNKTRKVNDFDYEKYAGKNSNAMPKTNVLGEAPNKNYTNRLKMFVSNSEMKKRSYVQENPDGSQSVSYDIFVEECVKNRTAQVNLMNRIKAKLRLPGDSDLRVGQTIIFNVPSVTLNNGTKELDKYYSGKYLVTAVRHIIQTTGTFQSIVEISREGPESKLD